MKISIDTDTKTIELTGKSNIKELWDMVSNMFGEDADNWNIELMQSIPQGPIARTPSREQFQPSERVIQGNIEGTDKLEEQFKNMYGASNPYVGNPLSFEESK